jgi:plastocyanin
MLSSKHFVILLFCVFVITTNDVFAEDHKVAIPKGAASNLCATFHNCYAPEKITINVSDSVTWINDDTDVHTATSGKPGEIFNVFDSGFIKAGESWSFVFDDPGVFDYFCTIHPWMIGHVTVIGQKVQKEPETKIPQWVKNNAKWWADGMIKDSDFVNGIQYMIQNGMIKIPKAQQENSVDEPIPEWVKNNAKWWADGIITDSDFVNGIQYMIQKRIIRV